MEKGNINPNVESYQRMPDAPPNYNQSQTTVPSAVAAGTTPPGPVTMMIQCPPIPPLGPHPCLITCPHCHHQKLSTVRMESATKTHLLAGLLCLVGLCCCVCVPYFLDSCKNANHYCSNCEAYLGVYTN